ncbi:hypothetical protein C1N53_02855 [Pontibacter sp. SGAir0037]|nr:hypothetical protein C1N53_02855 [Pontibacter sp. SGAir0037]
MVMKLNILYKKGLKRLGKITKRVVPHQTKFKPTGVYQLQQADSSFSGNGDVVVHSIYPNYVTTLDISEELYQACSEYWKPQRKVVTDYVVVEVPNGRIHTDNEISIAVITSGNQVVENVSLSLREGKVVDTRLNSIFRQQYFTKPDRFKGTVFSMLSGGAGINNIGHWFLDVLPRLHLLQESGMFDQVDWFLVPSTRYSYQSETLKMMGIPLEKVITGETYTHIQADKIIASTAPRGNHTLVPSWLLDYMRNAFLPKEQQEFKSREIGSEGPFIYISRRDSSIRNVLNEEELQNVLGNYGFQTILSSNLSISEKINLFSKAKLVLSPTGAGLISMLFCQPGTKLVEIFNEGFVIEPFFDIATKLNLDYKYIICKTSGKKIAQNATQGQHDHLVVETEKVEELLKELV